MRCYDVCAIEPSTAMRLVFCNGMRCTLILQWVDEGREQTAEHTFDHERITIGRGVWNTCVLKDSTRMVSTKHAEISVRDGAWILCDVGSTNGTMLNGVRIAQKQEHGLHDGDQIAVGHYHLSFRCATASATSQADPAPVAQMLSPTEGPATDPQRLGYLLYRAYGEYDPSSGIHLERHLDEVLHQSIGGCDGNRARAALQALRAVLGGSADPVVDMSKPLSAKNIAGERPAQPNRAPHILSVDVARKVGEKLALSARALNAEQLAAQLTSIFEVVCVGLADAVRGRRTFQKEFEVEATRILARTPNPINAAENAEEVAAILLDPSSRGLSNKQAMASLTDVFQDLTLHQLGLMAGFRECIRGLLKELDPERLEQGAENRSKEKRIGLLGGGALRTDAAAWRRYKDKHRQLSEEEVKVFERILAPHFSKGYLSVHTRRPRG